jgi:hypothetical protein
LRSVLAQTFLALLEDGKLEPADRAQVLPALFRPGVDGFIHEETGADGIAAMLARFLEKPRG